MNKLISVIIPTYNNEKTILHTLEAIYNQKFENYEVIIVNDGSKDNSRNLIDKYIKDKCNFKQIYKENTGVSDSRNYGVKIATGQYITFMDSDDYIEDGYFDDFEKNNNNYDLIVYGYKQHYNDDCKCISINCDKQFENKQVFYELLSKNNLFNTVWNKFFKRKIIDNISFNTSFDIGEDMDFVVQFLNNKNCNKIMYRNKCYYNYALSLNGLGFKRRSDTFVEKYMIFENLIKFYNNNNFDRKYLDTLLFKVYLSGFIVLYENSLFNKKKVYEYIQNTNQLVDFSNTLLSYKLKLINYVINSKNIFIIKILTVLLLKINILIKKRKFGFR